MLREKQYIYNGSRLVRVNPQIGRVEADTGEIVELSVHAPNVPSTGNYVFNFKKNGTALLEGADRITINTGNKRVVLTTADFGTITTVAGDLLSFALEEIGPGGIPGDIIFRVVIDDGISAGGAEALDELSDVVITTPANDDFIQRKGGTFVNRTIAQVKADLNLSNTNSGDETASRIGGLINSATAKTTPVDTDQFGLMDSTDNILKKFSWFNLKAKLKDYFDTLYQVILVSGTNIKTVNGTSVLGSGNISISSGASALDDLTDVVISSPSNTQILQFNGTNWVNGANTPTGNGFSYFNPDAPYASPNTIDDDFTGSSLDAKWIRDTAGATPTITFNTPYSHLCMKSQASACAYMQTAPSGDYKIRAKVFCSAIGGDVGILFKHASGYHGIVLTGATPLIYRVTGSLASLSFSSAILSNTTSRSVVYLQLEKVSTVITCSYSFDGLTFFAESSNTSGITPTNVGIYQKSTTSTVAAYFDWFRLVDSSGFTGRQISV